MSTDSPRGCGNLVTQGVSPLGYELAQRGVFDHTPGHCCCPYLCPGAKQIDHDILKNRYKTLEGQKLCKFILSDLWGKEVSSWLVPICHPEKVRGFCGSSGRYRTHITSKPVTPGKYYLSATHKSDKIYGHVLLDITEGETTYALYEWGTPFFWKGNLTQVTHDEVYNIKYSDGSLSYQGTSNA